MDGNSSVKGPDKLDRRVKGGVGGVEPLLWQTNNFTAPADDVPLTQISDWKLGESYWTCDSCYTSAIEKTFDVSNYPILNR